MNELDATEWIALVRQDCEFPDVVECLERHGVSVANVEWQGAQAELGLPGAGVTLHLQRSNAGVFVAAVEFAVSGSPEGASYDGSLPHGIDGADTLMDITVKLHPAIPTPGNAHGSFDAVFPEHRLVIRMDDDEILQSVTWATTREMSATGQDAEPPSL